MNAETFFKRLNQHCTDMGKQPAKCVKCWFRSFCYCPPDQITSDVVRLAEKKLSTEFE